MDNDGHHVESQVLRKLETSLDETSKAPSSPPQRFQVRSSCPAFCPASGCWGALAARRSGIGVAAATRRRALITTRPRPCFAVPCCKPAAHRLVLDPRARSCVLEDIFGHRRMHLRSRAPMFSVGAPHHAVRPVRRAACASHRAACRLHGAPL